MYACHTDALRMWVITVGMCDKHLIFIGKIKYMKIVLYTVTVFVLNFRKLLLICVVLSCGHGLGDYWDAFNVDFLI